MPEARLNLAQAVIALAVAPKSNAVIKAIDAASADVRAGKIGAVPAHLRDAHYGGAQKLGHGSGYAYSHDQPFGIAEQQYAPDVVAERFDRLKVVLERAALAKHEARIGRTEEVVVEGPSRKDPSVLTGRTRQNKLVHFASPSPVRAGSYARVEVTGAAPHFLRGSLVEVIASPRHRTRIPVVAG